MADRAPDPRLGGGADRLRVPVPDLRRRREPNDFSQPVEVDSEDEKRIADKIRAL